MNKKAKAEADTFSEINKKLIISNSYLKEKISKLQVNSKGKNCSV